MGATLYLKMLSDIEYQKEKGIHQEKIDKAAAAKNKNKGISPGKF